MKRLFTWMMIACLPVQAFAQSLVLDSEFAAYCRQLTAPLLPYLPHTQGASYVLIGDDAINAFVTSEKVIHVHSGLFLNAKGSSDIQGVLAHELGHLSSQHHLRMNDNMRTAMITGIAGAMVGLGAAIAGSPQAAAAGITFGQAGAISQLLRFSRTQEQEADQRAITALHGANLSAKGMVNTFEKLRVETQLSYGSLPPYLLTHPLPQVRLQSLQRAVSEETKPVPEGGDEAFKRMEAKVYALTHTAGETLRRYPGTSDADQYARVIAHARQGKLDEAEDGLKVLRKAAPNDPFYKEMGAQLALERGNLAAAETLLTEVLQQRPDLLLVRYQLAEVYRAQDKPRPAFENYRRVTEEWPVWAEPWYGMGIAYGKMGELALSHLSLAQAAVYSADKMEANAQLALARTYLKDKPDPQAQAWADELAPRIERMPTP